MEGTRPDPDQLLAQVNAEEQRARRGRLRIFFGATAGVGKTYSMLEAALAASASGEEIVVGYIEPHGRIETERMVESLEQLRRLPVHYRGIVRLEFDLDAALQRHPKILLVDELAHSNIVGGEPAPRHPKRWQDIVELLDAGISVWTTVNVQHLESLNDLVAKITGVRQNETVPDHVFDEADEIELIDLSPDDLLARLRAGKVYVPEEVGTAIERFFRKPNLLALRELALRRMADRVEASARVSFPGDQSARDRSVRDRVLVAVGPDLQAEQLVRSGKRLADALNAPWSVVYVETPALLHMSEAGRNRRVEVLQLAESLGAETVTLDGPSAAAVLLEYAQTRRATRVLVGAPKRSGWRSWLRESTGTVLAREARGFDVITVAEADHLPSAAQSAAARTVAGDLAAPVRWPRYLWALAITALCTAVAFAMYPRFELVNMVMVYLLGVTVAGLFLGRGPSVVTAVANVTAFDYCFVPPRFSFAAADAQYVVTFTVMLIVALVIANLMASVRQQTRVSGARERRTALLYAMSRELGATRGSAAMARVAIKHVAEVFDCQAVLLLPDTGGHLSYPQETALTGSLRHADLAVAQWVIDHGKRAGLGSDTLSSAPALYLPLGEAQRGPGVLAVLPRNPRRVLLPEQRHLLETFAGQIGLALERAQLAEVAESARIEVEGEALRNTLLAAISHDLRTPLAVMAGAGSTLAEHGATLSEVMRTSLARTVEVKAREMSELISNVLDLVRFESHQVVLRREAESLDELLGTVLHRHREQLSGHPVDLNLPDDLPTVHVDATLINQVFGNLFDNAAKYTPAGTHISIAAVADGSFVRIMVDDNGPGLPGREPERLFDKFQRGEDEGRIVGVGLGLAICRAIIRAHGGDITAQRRAGGGARFELTLPIPEPAA
jgi:two-component system sensor histidine kinase KdpD